MSATKPISITGCSHGVIGAAIALVLAQRGHHVFVTWRGVDTIHDALKSSENFTVLPLDVSVAESVTAAACTVAESGRGLDMLVNNAGVGYVRPVLDIDIGTAQRLFDVNLWGPLRTTQGFAGLLFASRGRIVKVSLSVSVVYSPWVCKFPTVQ